VGDLGIVRLLVREKSGAWFVDQGFMTRNLANKRKEDWNLAGWGCLMLKHSMNTVRIAPRAPVQITWSRRMW
jgi:hypothetical protein